MQRKGFLTRLRRDTRGNTLAIVGAAMVPLAAMIGSGVDMSRAYMAKTRLQSACDAAALAARRVMTDDTMNDTVRDEARRFMNFNFPQGLYQTATFTPNVTRPEAGTVQITANTTIPTTIMSMFGFESLPLDVSCEASLNFVNTDVMLVLDVTGSMDQNLSGTKKIVSLRDAVMALYGELRPVQTQLEAAGLRLRYGIVPYSSTVNVGHLIEEEDPDYLVDSAAYQSRVFNYNTLYHEESRSDYVYETYNGGESITQNQCDKYGRNQSFGSFSPSPTSGGGPPPTETWTRSYSNNETSGEDWGWSDAPDHRTNNNDNKMSCRRRYRTTTSTYPLPLRYVYTDTTYQQEVIDVSDYKRFREVAIVTRNPEDDDGSTVDQSRTYDPLDLAEEGDDVETDTVTWNGCIEERDTVDTINASSGYSIPANAFDLDINLVPHDDATRWRPMFPRLEYRRSGGSTSSSSGSSMSDTACPAAAVRLKAFTQSEMQTYVDALRPVGSTYHDIGMIWGARLISNAGVFADSPDVFNGMPVARHIIFMTDGQLEPSTTTYSSYGIETNDKRITGSSSGSGQYDAHLQRFRMVCNAAKSMNVSIWVIAFGTTLTDDMRNCASNPSQASTSSNRDQLIERFRQIGNQIGALRLTQ